MRGRTSLGPLRDPQFRLLWTAQAVSVVGDFLVPVALAFAILDLTGSVGDLGLVFFARALPMVAFLLAGGVWADRVPRERLLVLSNLTRFATQGTLAMLLLTGSAEIWEIVLLLMLHGTATAFFRPAVTGLVPQVVDRERLQQANALLSLAVSFGQIAGPAAAGVLVVAVGAGWAILLDAGTFLVAALLLSRLRVGGRVAQPRTTFARDLGEGWREVRSRDWLWISIVNFAIFQSVVLSAFVVLGPAVAKESLGGAGAWALIAVGFGIGTALGNVLALRLRVRRPLVVSYLLILGTAPSLVLLAEAAPARLIASTEILSGIAVGLGGALWETTLQQQIPPHALSRVSAYDWMGSTALRPLGLLLIAPVAAALGLEAALVGAAVVVVVTNALVLSVPSVRAVESPVARRPHRRAAAVLAEAGPAARVGGRAR